MGQVVRALLRADRFTTANKSAGTHIHQDDIVLNLRGWDIASIEAYHSSVEPLSHLVDGVNEVALRVVDTLRPAVESALQSGVHLLQVSQWQSIRAIIIELNPDLRDVIERLEDAQRMQPRLVGETAIAYDLVRSLISAFKPDEMQDWRDHLRSAREAQRASRSPDIGTLVSAITTTPLANKVELSQFPDEVEGFAEAIPDESDVTDEPDTEEEPIIYEERRLFPEFEPNPAYFADRRWNRFGMRMVDGTRELFILLAHRQGASGSDAMGADLVYMSRINHSFILVQYKVLERVGRSVDNEYVLRIGKREKKQMTKLLAACHDVQGCENRVIGSEPGSYLDMSDIRLGHCPAYYKLIRDGAKLVPSSEFLQGSYAQACYLMSVLQHSGLRSIRDPADLERTLGYEQFIQLAGNANIGTRAAYFDAMVNRARKELKSDVIAVALELPSQSAAA